MLFLRFAIITYVILGTGLESGFVENVVVIVTQLFLKRFVVFKDSSYCVANLQNLDKYDCTMDKVLKALSSGAIGVSINFSSEFFPSNSNGFLVLNLTGL